MKRKSLWLMVMGLVALLAIGASSAAWAATANISPSDDAYVKTNQATQTFNDEFLTVKSQRASGPNPAQNWRALLKFDLSSIPAGSTINKASLVLYMETAPGGTRDYELHYGSNDSWTEVAVTYNSAFTGATPAPGLAGLLDTIPTGTAVGSLTWGANGPNGPSGTGTESLTSRVDLEFGGDQTISLIIKDKVDDNNPNRLASFTSDESTTLNPKPLLVVDYTPPAPCTAATLELTAFSLATDMPIELNTEECFEVTYTVKAGCKALSFVKTQGGFGGNLVTSAIIPSKGNIEVKEVGRGNKVVTWTIPDGLAPNEEATLDATVCTGKNPKGIQLWTSCGVYPITGAWSSTAVVAEDSSIISSTPPYTDRLEVEVICPGTIFDEVVP